MATLQFADATKNNRLEAIELSCNGRTLSAGTGTGTDALSGTWAVPHLLLYSGSLPANCAAAATGTLLCDITLPNDWMSAASTGSKAKNGTWSGTGAAGASTGTNVGYFRITNAAGTTCYLQGDVTATGGGGAMTMDNINVATGQAVTVNTFSLTDAN